MIHYKTEKEIAIMREGGVRLQKVAADLMPTVRSGITTMEIETLSDILIKKYGGESSFKRVPGYHWNTCIPINEQAVHTPPSGRVIKDGDIVTVDIGIYFQGYHIDYADTVIVGEQNDPDKVRFLQAGKEALKKSITQAKVGNRIGDITKATYEVITKQYGYHILRELTGHGIGHNLHEDPYIPNFPEKKPEKTTRLLPGLTAAIEVIYSQGSDEIVYEEPKDWSIVSSDRSLCACFEHSVAITEKETFILA